MGRQKRNKIASLFYLLAVPGMVVFLGFAGYDVYLDRTNPTSPDAVHSVEQMVHGNRRYYTPTQAKMYFRVPFTGLAQSLSFALLATFLSGDCKINKGVFSRGGP